MSLSRASALEGMASGIAHELNQPVRELSTVLVVLAEQVGVRLIVDLKACHW